MSERKAFLLPGFYQHSFISREEAMTLMSDSSRGFQSMTFLGDEVSYVGPGNDPFWALLKIPRDVRFEHVADRSSIQELLERTHIAHLFIDSTNESHLLLPTSSLELVKKLFECASISIHYG
jgi:hypothetical protein